MSDSPELLKHLGNRSAIDALAVIEALEKKRREDEFVKYWTATDKQAEIFPQFTSDLKLFGILGGNRSGKTELGALISIAWALGPRYFYNEPSWEYIRHLPIPDKPNNIWVVGLDFPTLRDVIWREKLIFGRNHPPLLPKDEAIVRKISEADYQIFFKNGSIITGKSADSGREKFQGASVDLVWIDEEPEGDIYDECYQRTVDCRGRILLTLTPLTDTHSGVRTPWVFDLYEDAKVGAKKDVKFVQLSVMDNPYVPQEEKDKLLTKWAGHFEERARLYGEFIQRSGLVYNMWKPSIHMVKPFPIPREWRRIVSIDPAATGTTAALAIAVTPRNNYVLYREYYERDKVVSDHAKDMLIRFGHEPIDIWLIDPKWGAQRDAANHKTGADLYRENGIPVRLADVDEDYGLNASREYLNAALFETSRHPKVSVFDDLHHFKYEIEHYVWDFYQKGDQKGLSKDKPAKRNDHLLNAFQYACAMRFKGRTGRQLMSIEERQKDISAQSYT